MKRITPYILSSSAYIAGAGLTITSAWLITMASFQPPILTLSVSIVMVRFFGISRSVARYGERISSHKQVFDQLTRLRVRLFNKITSSPRTLMYDKGTIVKRVVDDVERAQEYQLRITLPHVASIVTVSFGALVGFWIQPQSLMITVPVGFLILFIIPIFVQRGCEEIARGIENAESEYASLVAQASHGVVEAQLYGYLNQRLEQTQAKEEELLSKERSLLKLTRRFQFLFVLLIGLTLVVLTWMAQHFSKSEKMPAVQVSMLIFLALVMFEAVTVWYPNLFSAGKLLLAKKEIALLESSPTPMTRERVEISGQVRTLQVSNVRVAWSPNKAFMSPVSFELQSGQCLVINGRSGSGKSTLAMALLGLLDYEGEIKINGHELNQIANLSEYVVGTIQISHIFNTTIRENLKIANPDANDVELRNALSCVELDALIDQMPQGLDTIIGQYGRALSGGEAKRITLARAILSPAHVLILDEPTEHLDEELSLRIQKQISGLGRTLIVITHSRWLGKAQTLELVR